jgi:hypothetical protein
MRIVSLAGVLAAGALLLPACGGRPATDPPAASVTILSPAEGDTVSLPVTVRLSATGVEVIPASGAVEPGKGHHHVVVDVDVPDPALPLPSQPGVIHLGSGAQELVLDSLPPGPRRLIAVFASGDHVAMPGVRQDTVRFVVR